MSVYRVLTKCDISKGLKQWHNLVSFAEITCFGQFNIRPEPFIWNNILIFHKAEFIKHPWQLQNSLIILQLKL